MKKKVFQLQLLSLMSGVQKVGYDEIVTLGDKYSYTLGCSARGVLTDKLGMLDSKVVVETFPSLVREIHPIKDLLALIGLVYYFRKISFDVVHTHSSKTGFIGRLAAKLCGVPIVVHTVHGFAFPTAKGKIGYSVMYLIEWFAKFFTDTLIVLNEADYQAAVMQLGYSEKAVRIMPNGVDIDHIESGVSHSNRYLEYHILRDKRVVLMLGRLWPQKNPKLLVDAAITNLKHRTQEDLIFVFAGDGPLRSSLEAEVKRVELSEHFLFLGWVDNVLPLLGCADVFVLPSLWEGMPLAILEAFAARVPVVVSDIEAHKSFVSDKKTGFLFESDNVKSLVDVLEMVLNSSDMRQNVSSNAYEKVIKEYRLDRRCVELSEIYEG